MNPMSSLELIKKVWNHNPLAIVVVVSVMTVSNFIQATSAITLAPVVDLVIHSDLQGLSHPTSTILKWMGRFGLPPTLPAVMLLFLGMIVVKNLMAGFSKFIVLRASNAFQQSLIVDEYRSFLGAGWPFFVQQRHGMLVNTIIRETEKVGSALEAIGDLLSSLLGIVFYLGLGFLVSWKLTLLVLILLGIGLVPFLLLGKFSYRLGKAHTDNSNDFFAAVQETFGAAKVIIGYANQDKSLARVRNIVPRFMQIAIRYVMVRDIVTPLAFEPFGFLIIFVSIFAGVNYFGLSVPELFVLLYAFTFVNKHGLNVAARRNGVKNLMPAYEQVLHLRAEALAMAQPTGSRKIEGLQEGIVFKEVFFHYPSNKQALEGVSVRIPKGKMVAIVGRSGSGKTTLIDVLMGFYTPQDGVVTVDGMPFAELDIDSWRRRIGYIPQEAVLFNMSIKDNLLWGNAAATDQEIAAALEMSNSSEFIRELSSGLETMVGEHGVRLSGGQRQRLALARAILRQPDLLVLDEATSSLDSHSEQLIQASIERLSRTTTIVAIAHRLSTIKKADYIYVMDSGKVIEEGTFEQLIRAKGGEFLKTAEIQGVL